MPAPGLSSSPQRPAEHLVFDCVMIPTLSQLCEKDPKWAPYLQERQIQPVKKRPNSWVEPPKGALPLTKRRRTSREATPSTLEAESGQEHLREMAQRRLAYETQRAANIERRDQILAGLFHESCSETGEAHRQGSGLCSALKQRATTHSVSASPVHTSKHAPRKNPSSNKENVPIPGQQRDATHGKHPTVRYTEPLLAAGLPEKRPANAPHQISTSHFAVHPDDATLTTGIDGLKKWSMAVVIDSDDDWSDEEEGDSTAPSLPLTFETEVKVTTTSSDAFSTSFEASSHGRHIVTLPVDDCSGHLEWKNASLMSASVFIVIGRWDETLDHPVAVIGCRSCHAAIPPHGLRGHMGTGEVSVRQQRKAQGRSCGMMTLGPAKSAANAVLDYLQHHNWLPVHGRHDKGDWLFSGRILQTALPMFPIALKSCCNTCHRGFTDKWSAKAHCNRYHPTINKATSRWTDKPAQCLRSGTEWNEITDTAVHRLACDGAGPPTSTIDIPFTGPTAPSMAFTQPWCTPLYHEFFEVMGWTLHDFERLPSNSFELATEPNTNEQALGCVAAWFRLWKAQILKILESNTYHNVRKALNSAKGGYKFFPLRPLMRQESERRYLKSQLRLLCWALRLSRMESCQLHISQAARELLQETWDMADTEVKNCPSETVDLHTTVNSPYQGGSASSDCGAYVAVEQEWKRILHIQRVLFALHQPMSTPALHATNRAPASIWSSYVMSFSLVIGMNSKGQFPKEVNDLSSKLAQLTRFIREICLGEIILNNGSESGTVSSAIEALRPHYSDGSPTEHVYPFGMYRYGMRYLRNDHNSRRTMKTWMVEEAEGDQKFRIVGLPASQLQQGWTSWQDCGKRIRDAMQQLRDDFFRNCLCGNTLEDLGLSHIDVHFVDSSRERTAYYTRCSGWEEARTLLWRSFQQGTLRQRFFQDGQPNQGAWQAWLNDVCRWCCDWATLDWATTVPCRLRANFSCKTERGIAAAERDIFWIEDGRLLKIVREDKSCTTSGKRYYTPRISLKTMSELKLLCDLIVRPTVVCILSNTAIPLSTFRLAQRWTREEVVEHFQTSHCMFSAVPDYNIELKLWANSFTRTSASIIGYRLTSQKWRQFCFGALLGRPCDYSSNTKDFDEQLLFEGNPREAARLAMAGHNKRTDMNCYEGQRADSLHMVLSGPLAHYHKISGEVRAKWHLEDE
ncbi:hypothetical protein CALCODRAFT_559242 [Calocera cornea HHB12733]|uniref:Uncharacterized protein n=1 Tax=Calocera cornea HHB12733 TaxID=1353952 RepID=A0A165C1K2_9BASI|nr:hypothetical protein CALCODRAFT_559242 [Calocera cornea HHB12733]